ncbi:hypothetical protein C8J57DRAFT_1680604 [Mycena rebaudengoi]|nr:hypothetical protein C8J57DRAFT_1680604 [Mycena rebaudengoi]
MQLLTLATASSTNVFRRAASPACLSAIDAVVPSAGPNFGCINPTGLKNVFFSDATIVSIGKSLSNAGCEFGGIVLLLADSSADVMLNLPDYFNTMRRMMCLKRGLSGFHRQPHRIRGRRVMNKAFNHDCTPCTKAAHGVYNIQDLVPSDVRDFAYELLDSTCRAGFADKLTSPNQAGVRDTAVLTSFPQNSNGGDSEGNPITPTKTNDGGDAQGNPLPTAAPPSTAQGKQTGVNAAQPTKSAPPQQTKEGSASALATNRATLPILLFVSVAFTLFA